MSIQPVDSTPTPTPTPTPVSALPLAALAVLDGGLPLNPVLAFELALANPPTLPLPTLASLAQANDATNEAAVLQEMVAAADTPLIQAMAPAATLQPLAQINDAANLAVQQQELLAATDATLLQAMAAPATEATALPDGVPLPAAPLLPVLAPLAATDTTVLPAGFPIIPVDPVTDPQVLALAAQDATILGTQQAVQAAIQAGASDVSLVLSGLPQGATALMMGAGWTPIIPDGLNGAESAASWAFHFPLRVLDVPAVTGATLASHTGVKGKPADLPHPLTAYGSHGEPEPQPGTTFASTMDLLD